MHEPNEDIRTVVVAELSLVPGGALAAVADRALSELRRERAREFGRSLMELASEDDVVSRLATDERLADVFTRAVEASVRTSHEAKRQAMARVVASASTDEAEIDGAELLVWALEQLEAPHFRLLGELAEVDGDGDEVSRASADYPVPVCVTLERVGVVRSGELDNGTRYITTEGPDHRDSGAITDFGRQLLAYLNSAR